MAIVPGKAPTPPTVTLKHLAAALAETHEMSKKQAEAVLGDFLELWQPPAKVKCSNAC